MSTRSGKRIHSSPNEQPLKIKEVKTDRKTRSQKQKENCDGIETVVKKKNYVLRNPSEDDTYSDASSQVDNCRTRKSRRTTLKELNVLVLDTDADIANNTIKKSRGTKKVENKFLDPPQKLSKKSKKKKMLKNNIIENTVESEIIRGKKKLKKKKTSSGSLVIEDLNEGNTQVNKSNISMDSFHSASGSVDNSPECDPNKYVTKMTDSKMDSAIFGKKESNKKNSLVVSHDHVDSGILTVTVHDEIEPVIKDVKNKSRKRVLPKNYEKNDNTQDYDKNISKKKLKHEEVKSHDKSTINNKSSGIEESELSFKHSSISDFAEANTHNATPEKNDDTTDNERRSSLIIFDKSQEINDNKNRNCSIRRSYDKQPDLILSKKREKNKSFDNNTSDINMTFEKDTSAIATKFEKGTSKVSITLDEEAGIKVKTPIKKGISKETPVKKRSSYTPIKHKINKDSMPFKNSISKVNTTFEQRGSNIGITSENDTSRINTTFEKDTSKTNTTFDKDTSKINTTFDKDTSKINTTFDKDTSRINTTFEKDTSKTNTTFDKDTSKINTTFDKDTSKINTTFDKDTSKINTTFDKDTSKINITFNKDTSRINTTLEKNRSKYNTSFEKDTSRINTTFDKDTSSINTTFEKDTSNNNNIFDKDTSKNNTTFEKDTSNNNTTLDSSFKKKINNQEKIDTMKDSAIKTKLNVTSEENTILDITFEKVVEKDSLGATFDKPGNISKSSLISSDASNLTDDKSLSRVSITSDDSRTENIVNTTPVLIESSMDESLIISKSPKLIDNKSNIRQGSFIVSPLHEKSIEKTPPTLLREDTFTKESESPIKVATPPDQSASPGCTPFPSSKRSSTKKRLLNVTRSIEKSQRLSVAELPRATRVMFCSPVNTPMIVNQTKGKVIKSSMKGSNKSFVFNESVSVEELVGTGRKRSYTLGDAEDIGIKRKRLASDGQPSTGRLSRSRTSSASGKVASSTPSKSTPVKAMPESKVGRKKLPNFAALHQKQFDKMESLDQCQERKARRARQLLAAAGDRDSKADTSKIVEKKKRLPTLESINPGYTRFGFKMNSDVNPFATNNDDANVSLCTTKNDMKLSLNTTRNGIKPPNTTKTDAKLSLNTTKTKINPFVTVSKIALKSKENIPNGLKRQATLPSLAGSTARKEIARQTVMREKSFAEKRNTSRQENRTVIKGVRTNRRFELQMQMRNIS